MKVAERQVIREFGLLSVPIANNRELLGRKLSTLFQRGTFSLMVILEKMTGVAVGQIYLVLFKGG